MRSPRNATISSDRSGDLIGRGTEDDERRLSSGDPMDRPGEDRTNGGYMSEGRATPSGRDAVVASARRRFDEIISRDALTFMNEFPDALIVVTPDAGIVFWSSGAERMFGFARNEVLDRPLGEILRAPVRDTVERDAWDAVISHSGSAVYETTRTRKDGSAIVVDATVRALRAENGAVEFIAISKKDVT